MYIRKGYFLSITILVAMILCVQSSMPRLKFNLTLISWAHLVSEQPSSANPYHLTLDFNAHQCNEQALTPIQNLLKEASEDQVTNSAYRHLTESLLWCGDSTSAVEMLEMPLPTCQNDPWFRLMAGNFAFRSQQWEKAGVAWDCPALQKHLLAVGRIILDQGRADAAHSLYQILTMIDDHNALAYLGIGNTFRYQGVWDQAKISYERAYKLNSTNGDILANYATAIFKTNGNPEKARDLIQQAILLEPSNVWLYSHLVDYYTSRSQYSDAEAVLLDAVVLFPERHVPSLLLGYVYMNWGKPEQAISVLQKADQIGDYSGQTSAALGSAYDQIGQYEMAIQHHLQATLKAPHYIPYGVNLASSYAQMDRCEGKKLGFADRTSKL